jgi:hypothetical protein
MDVKDDAPTFGSTVRVQQQTTNNQNDGPTFGAALHNTGRADKVVAPVADTKDEAPGLATRIVLAAAAAGDAAAGAPAAGAAAAGGAAGFFFKFFLL